MNNEGYRYRLPVLCFDMDGTLADLYGVDGWLESLRAEDATPYYLAEPLDTLNVLNAFLERYKALGGYVCVVSWLAKGEPSKSFRDASTSAKMLWLRKYLPAITDYRIVEYGTPKSECVRFMERAILFDDELDNVREFCKDRTRRVSRSETGELAEPTRQAVHVREFKDVLERVEELLK